MKGSKGSGKGKKEGLQRKIALGTDEGSLVTGSAPTWMGRAQDATQLPSAEDVVGRPLTLKELASQYGIPIEEFIEYVNQSGTYRVVASEHTEEEKLKHLFDEVFISMASTYSRGIEALREEFLYYIKTQFSTWVKEDKVFHPYTTLEERVINFKEEFVQKFKVTKIPFEDMKYETPAGFVKEKTDDGSGAVNVDLSKDYDIKDFTFPKDIMMSLKDELGDAVSVGVPTVAPHPADHGYGAPPPLPSGFPPPIPPQPGYGKKGGLTPLKVDYKNKREALTEFSEIGYDYMNEPDESKRRGLVYKAKATYKWLADIKKAPKSLEKFFWKNAPGDVIIEDLEERMEEIIGKLQNES